MAKHPRGRCLNGDLFHLKDFRQYLPKVSLWFSPECRPANWKDTDSCQIDVDKPPGGGFCCPRVTAGRSCRVGRGWPCLKIQPIPMRTRQRGQFPGGGGAGLRCPGSKKGSESIGENCDSRGSWRRAGDGGGCTWRKCWWK